MITIQKYKLELIRDSSCRYDLDDKKIKSPKDAYSIIEATTRLSKQAEEVILLITLDTKNQVSGVFEVGRGNINSAIVSPREIFKRAILNNSTNIIIAHNHPSQDPSPSECDLSITKNLIKCGEILGIALLDHLIVCENNYFSFQENSLF